jgi:polyphosphate glucokinase
VTIVEILGIDIGGTGIKGAPVDTLTGELLGERFRLLTPSPATPAAVSATVAEVAAHFSWQVSSGVVFRCYPRWSGAHGRACGEGMAWL